MVLNRILDASVSLEKLYTNTTLVASIVDTSVVLEVIRSIFTNQSSLLSYNTFCNFPVGMCKLSKLASIWSSIVSLQFSSISGQEHETFYQITVN